MWYLSRNDWYQNTLILVKFTWKQNKKKYVKKPNNKIGQNFD